MKPLSPAALINALTLRTLAAALGAAAAAMLIAALIAQYGFSLHPCELCMAQRYPYGAVVFLAIVAWFLRDRRALMIVVLFIGLLLAVDAGIAAYHTGVEAGVFPGPSACTSTAKPGETLEELRRQIMNAAQVPCDQPMAYIFGLSLAAWNAIAASLMTLAAFYLLWRIRRKERQS